MVEYLVGSGQTQQVICGKKLQGEDDVIVRTKRGKVKRMACPMPLTVMSMGDSESSIEDCLQNLAQASGGALLQGYDWETQSPDAYTEETRPRIEGEDVLTEWTTTKTMQILQFPRHFFLTLERFAYTANGERILRNATLQVPMNMKVLEGKHFSLCGGVIHVSEDSIDEEGHYVTLVASSSAHETPGATWTLIDDETCREIASETAQRWLCGAEDENSGNYYCSTLLAYRCTDENDGEEWLQLAARIRQQEIAKEDTSSSAVDWSQPQNLVGRKLKVGWAKGKFYEGLVNHYDATTGKHRVMYNDGDVREYTLSQKTIKWL